MKDSIKGFILLFVMILLTCFVGYFSWKAERHFNWKLSYEEEVKQQVEPLKQQIIDLQNRIKKLEDASKR